MQDFYGKQYKLNKSAKFDEYMKATGVDMMTRKLGGTVSPVIQLTEAVGVYTLKSTSTFKNTVISLKLGEEFDEETPDDRKVKFTITRDGNKLTHILKGEPKDTEIIREFSPEQVLMTLKVDDIVCTRLYKAI